jgi:hypothetical protein
MRLMNVAKVMAGWILALSCVVALWSHVAHTQTMPGLADLGDLGIGYALGAVINVAAVSNWLQITYSKKKWFRPFQQDMTPYLDDLNECPDEPIKGRQWDVPLYLASANNVRSGAEGSSMPQVSANSEVLGTVNAQEFKGAIQLTHLLNLVGAPEVSWNGGQLAQQMKENTTDLSKLMQIELVLSHGTGRLAVVDAAVVAGNTFLARLPVSIHGLRKNMKVDFVDLDTGGAVQVTNRKITAIDRTTRGITGAGAINTYAGTVTFDGAAANLTAGWGVYITGDYGTACNGMRGLVSNGDLTSTFLGQSRTSQPLLNANVFANSGTPRPISEDLMRFMADAIFHNGAEVESIRCNTGVMNEVAKLSVNQKRYSVIKGEFPKYITGWREGDLLFAYDKAVCVIKKDPNIPAREMYFLCFKDSFYKHTTAEMGWLSKGANGVLLPTPSSGGGGYDYSWTALLYAAINQSNYYPLANGVIRDITDPGLAGDS